MFGANVGEGAILRHCGTGDASWNKFVLDAALSYYRVAFRSQRIVSPTAALRVAHLRLCGVGIKVLLKCM
jgi:hypothetical protein